MRTFRVREHGILRPDEGASGPTPAEIEALLDTAAIAGRRLAVEPSPSNEATPLAADDRVLVPARKGAVRAKGVVGVLVSDGATLEILPKVDREDDDRARRQLVHMLADALDLPLHLGPDALLAHQDRTLLDVVIAAFVARLDEAVRRGLARRYVPANDDLPVLRGRLDVRRQYTTLLAMPYRIACRFDELSVDTPLNRSLKAALVLLRRHAREEPTRRAILTLLPAFDGVRDRAADFPAARRQIDRTDRAFHELLALAELLMRGEYQGTSGGARGGIALLFDMPTLFERAIEKAMRRALSGRARVVAQSRSKALMTNPRSYTLKPDLLIECGDFLPIVIDTKWKHLDGAARPASADAYQMLAYAQGYEARDCVLLYPTAGGEDGIVSTWLGRTLTGSRGPFEWKLHRATVALNEWSEVPRRLSRLLGTLTGDYAHGVAPVAWPEP